MRWFYRGLDLVAELMVMPSYIQWGYRLRRDHLWDDQALDVSMKGCICVVTGANAGLGRATTEALLAREASVVMVCRHPERAAKALVEIQGKYPNADLSLELCDISDLAAVKGLAASLSDRHEAIDVLINNAGVMLHERQESIDGIELGFATNILGGFVLTHALEPALRRAPHARVIHVSSGGMYTQKLHVSDLEFSERPYQGVKAYAEHKRAQVVLNELWAERWTHTTIDSYCMHPGWADTPGVSRSLPGFHRFLGTTLRDAEAGADTVVWLAISPKVVGQSGLFWFDRKARRTHLSPLTKSCDADRRALWALCVEKATKSTSST